MIAGYATMLGLNVDMTRAQVTWRMILLGVGLGPALPLFTLAIQNSVNQREIGAATSSSQFFRQIGSTIGVAVFGTVMATTLSAQLPRFLPAGMRAPGMNMASLSIGQLQSGSLSGAANMTAEVMGALKLALTAAIQRVYLLGLLVIIAGFLVTLFLPELALRKTEAHATQASAEG